MIDQSKLDRFISLEDAGQQLDIDQSTLYCLIADGSLHAVVLPDGSIAVSLRSVQSQLPRNKLPEYLALAHLKGRPISISDASRKYGIHTSTLTRWMQRSYIARIGKDGRRTLLNEADVAYYASGYLANRGQGKWTFDEKGKPITAGGKRLQRRRHK